MPFVIAFSGIYAYHSSHDPCENVMKYTEISSAQNPRYKVWLQLTSARAIKKNALALLHGRTFIDEVLERYPHRAAGIITPSLDMIQGAPLPENCPVYLLSSELFGALDIYGIKNIILLVDAPPLTPWDGELTEGLTVFVPFQNPINLGTAIRSAAALGAHVVLLQEAATPYLPKSLRASGPALFQIPVLQGPSIKQLATLTHLPLYGLSLAGQNIYTFPFPKTVGLVAGAEGPGLDDFWPVGKRLTIPMHPSVESLNACVSMSIGMALFQAQLQHSIK